jgi:hypothetical protein
MPDGSRYYGPLVNGKLNGRGRLEWQNGNLYEGEFRDGLMSGKGRFTDPKGEVHEGEFQKGEFTGQVRQVVIAGGSPDIRLTADMTDVRCDSAERNPALCTPNGPGPPAYIGQTDVVVPIDLTDNCNYPLGTTGSCPAPPTSGTLSRTIEVDFPMPPRLNVTSSCFTIYHAP